MDLTDVPQRFCYPFYLLGLNSFNPFLKMNHCSAKRIPVIILTLTVVFATITIFVSQYLEHSLRSLVVINIAAVSFIFIEFITCVIIIGKSMEPGRITENLWNNFRLIQQLYTTKFNMNIKFKQFYCIYCCEIGTMLCLHFAHIAVNILFNYGIYDIIVKFMTLVLFSVALATMFHILFYVRLLVHVMQLINERFANSFDMQCQIFRLDSWKQQVLINNFRFIKQIHYLVWNVSVMINKHFGWIFVSLFLQNSFDSVHTVYWIVWYLDRNEDWAKTKLLSKYFIYFIFNCGMICFERELGACAYCLNCISFEYLRERDINPSL